MDIVGKIHTPEDPEWAVWADALLAQGDPRGELIALERLSEAELRPDQVEQLEALRKPYIERFKTNAQRLLHEGWLTREVTRWRFGYALALDCTEPLIDPIDAMIEFFGGDPSNLDHSPDAATLARGSTIETARLAGLFGSEELSCLRSLRVEPTIGQLMPLIEALELHRPPIAELTCWSGDMVFADARTWGRLWSALPSLEILTCSTEVSWSGQISHPTLRCVSLIPNRGGVDSGAIIDLADAELPALEYLACFGSVSRIERLFPRLLQHPSSRALFERLRVFECRSLLDSCFRPNPADPLPDLLQPLRQLPAGLRVICACEPEFREEVCRLVPQLEFEFHTPLDRVPPWWERGKAHSLALWCRGTACQQERLELGSWVRIGRTLAKGHPQWGADRRELADELQRALDANGEVEIEGERLRELLGDGASPALQLHDGCCQGLRLTLEQRPTKDWMRLVGAQT